MTVPNPRSRQSDDVPTGALDRMSLSEIYRHEVLQSRRDRSRRAFFWARIVGLLLMLTIGATLRSEPDLRSALARVGMDAIKTAANQRSSTQAMMPDSTASALPRDRIKVNRFGVAPSHQNSQLDAQLIANEVGRRMAAQKITH